MWRTLPPCLIKAGYPHLPTVAVFATESVGAGTDAQITLTVDIPMDVEAAAADGGGGGGDVGGVWRATIMLRWVNPKIGMMGKWVEVVTSFRGRDSGSKQAGRDGGKDLVPVVYWDEPEQRDTSRVSFRIALEPLADVADAGGGGGGQIQYMPSNLSAEQQTQKAKSRFSSIPPLPPPPTSSLTPPPGDAATEEGVPPEQEQQQWDPDCPRCVEMEAMCGICLNARSRQSDAAASSSGGE